MRKTKSWWRNAYEAGARYLPKAFTAGVMPKAVESLSPTFGTWYARFKQGCRTRMGLVRIQNEPITSKIVHALDEIASEEWRDPNTTDKERVLLENVVCYVMFGYCNGLRGEEVPMISLKGLLHFWEETAASKEPFIMTTLYGKFKGEVDFRWHCLPFPEKRAPESPRGSGSIRGFGAGYRNRTGAKVLSFYTWWMESGPGASVITMRNSGGSWGGYRRGTPS